MYPQTVVYYDVQFRIGIRTRSRYAKNKFQRLEFLISHLDTSQEPETELSMENFFK